MSFLCLFLSCVFIGPDWKWGDQDGGPGNIGTVFRLKTPTEIYASTLKGPGKVTISVKKLLFFPILMYTMLQ